MQKIQYNRSMEIITLKDKCIITPLSQKLGSYETERLKQEIAYNPDKEIGIDLAYVKDCSIHFIEGIKSMKNVALFNIPSDIFSLFTFMRLDKILNLYVSEIDFMENKRRILSRNLTVLS